MFSQDNYASAEGERRDCAVRSFAVAACVSYDTALNLFADFGRELNRGTSRYITERVIEDQFPNAQLIDEPGLTLPKFAKQYNEGHYIVHVRRHALAVVDGVIHDWRPRPKTRVKSAWRLDT